MTSAKSTVLITGATDGIGRATAHALASRGSLVGVVGRSPDRTRNVVTDITRAGGAAFGIVADLSSMAEVRRAVDEVVSTVDRLDALVLNANHITQARRVTPDGFEANLAIGWLSRVLMMRGLDELLTASGGQVLSVVGMNLDRLETDDLALPGSPGGMRSLGQWQWAIQTYQRAWNAHTAVPANTYMPGLVKTKILADEPERLQRLAIKVAMRVTARTPQASAEHLIAALDALSSTQARDHYVAVAKDKGQRDLKVSAADIDRIWETSNRATHPWMN
ncbi:MAG: SDR family NAD(P)-dependent oxidoreductase [Flavobacteriales bacterium]